MRKRTRLAWALAGTAFVAGPAARPLRAQVGVKVGAQEPGPQSTPAPHQQPAGPGPTAPAAISGGTIRGTVKAGNIPLPGVAITATNTLTGRKYATATDIDGNYAMTIPRTGRYVVRAELAAFAPATSEVRITAEAADQVAAFGLELASRAAQAEAAAGTRAATGLATALARGTQALNISGDSSLSDASAGGGSGASAGASLPSLGALGADAGAGDSVAVSGQVGQTNGLANLSEDQIRDRIEEAVANARRQGGATGDQADAVVSMLGGLIGGGGFGGGGRGGGRGGGGGGGGGFARFNPTTPHGAIFYQGGFSGLDAQQSSAAELHALALGLPQTVEPVKPGTQQNRYGVSFTGSPYIPGLTKPSTRQFVFLNLTGSRSINPLNFSGTVPTLAQRGQVQLANGQLANTDANLSASQTLNGNVAALPIFDPTMTPASPTAPGTAFAGNIIPAARITAQARALLNLYPLPNVNGVTSNNYENQTTAGSDQTQASARYVRNFGAAGFGGGGRGGGRGGGANAPKALRQNLNASFSFSHSASDLRNLIPILGGKTSSQGYGLSTGYTVSYGRITNNASLNWNRSHATTLNFFTGQAIDPAVADGIGVPSQSAGLAQSGFYNGLPNIQLTSFYPLTEQQPRDAINQTISFSDFVSYGHGKHNFRFGTDVRRLHADQVGGNNVTGSFIFSGLVTESASDKYNTLSNSTVSTQQPVSGSALADLLLGQPQETKLQAGLFKTYLRENIFDAYAQDDYRVTAGVTLNYGLRYEYFSPYIEKNNHLVNLDHNADFTQVEAVQPGGAGTYLGSYPRSLVNPDRTMFAPRLGVAWRPRFVKNTVVRAGYGINFNTGQFAAFAQSLAFQPPFALTENNTLSTQNNLTGCSIQLPTNLYTPGNASALTLANGFSCSTKALTNNYAVNKDYRLGHVQVYNLNIQHTLPHGTVVNVGYNGSKGGNLDIVRAPNHTAIAVTTANAQAFTYEDSVAESRLQQLVVSARKRLEKGVALQVVYQYSHSIDNASSIGGTSLSQVQNDQRLDLEESNSSFDVRHRLTGNFVLELPFGPNRAFFNKGGKTSHVLDGFGISGDFTFASGTYFSPQYQNSAAQLAAGGTYTLRPDRVFSEPIFGPKTVGQWFNPAAFIAPQDTVTGFGTASRNSIEGPGTVQFDLSLSRSIQLGSTRSFETRATASNVFNTVQYTSIDTTENSATFGQVTGTAAPRRITFLGRYRF